MSSPGTPNGKLAGGALRRRGDDNMSMPATPEKLKRVTSSANFGSLDTEKTIAAQRKPSLWSTTAVYYSLLAVTVLAAATRLFRIESPSQVVFDEVHFGGFANQYLKREYFFDVHPPLGKLIFAGVGYMMGYDGSFSFAKIGMEYVGSTAPYVAMRIVAALFGIATVPLIFATIMEMGFSLATALMAAALLIFDNASIIQTRFILLDSMLFFFTTAATYSWVRFRKERPFPFQKHWWTWLVCTGISIACATGVKMVGLFSVGLIGVATVIDLWELADLRRRISDRNLFKHFGARAAALLILPAALYLSFFYIHLAVLTKSGPGDAFMTPIFQGTLEGSIMHTESRQVNYGQAIRMKSRVEGVFLHSHSHKYPLRHIDGKVSSEGQQVTGYLHEDPNNAWVFIRAKDNMTDTSLKVPIKNGDTVRLLHLGTQKVLMTHDVASPLTMTNQEITVVDPLDSARYNSTLWTVDIKTGGDGLRSKSTHFRLVHGITKVALSNYQKNLPAWGFEQREINGDKRGLEDNSKWIVDAIIDPMDDEEIRLKKSQAKPTMTFFQKYAELQSAMVHANANLQDNHYYKSSPWSWPFLLRGISFWERGKQARIYLLGNLAAWLLCWFGMVTFVATAARELFKQRRGCLELHKAAALKKYLYGGGFFFMAYVLHYIPFFTMGRVLYLHHYLPAYIFSTAVTAISLDYTLSKYSRPLRSLILGALGLMVLATFAHFAVITYGFEASTESLASKRWLVGWDWP